MKKFIKWLCQHKKRHYKVVYIATGFMGNRYDVGTYEFSVSDHEIRKAGYKNPGACGFGKNYRELSKYFKRVGSCTQFAYRNVY